MVLDSEQLRTFVAVAQTGSFTKAAADVHRTQAAVSMQIKKLEERVSRPLFDRSSRETTLTADGRRLLGFARKILALNDEALGSFSDIPFEGEVRLGLPDDYAERLLPIVLAAFHRSHPSVEICIECVSSTNVIDKINSGDIDIGLVTHADGGGQIIRREPLLWIGSDALAAHVPDPVPLALAGRDNCHWHRAAISALEDIGKEWRIVFCSPSSVAISSAVAAGLAFSALPESAVRSDLRIMTPADGFPQLPSSDIALVRSKQANQPVHDALADHIIRRLTNLSLAEKAVA